MSQTRIKRKPEKVAAKPEPQHPIVAILVPCYRQPHPRMSQGINALVKYSHEHGIQIIHTPIIQSSAVHWTRNALIVELLKSSKPFTHILFCDDDIVPPPDALCRLMSHGKDIIAALCTRRQDPPIPNARLFDEERRMYEELWEWPDGLIEVGAVGTGFMLISRHALQQVAEVYFQCLYEKKLYGVSDEWVELATRRRLEEFDNEPNAWWFKWLDREDCYGEYGEDVSFCHKATQCAGMKVYVDTTVQPEHMGDYGYTIQDFVSYRDPLIERAKAAGRYLKPPSLLNPKEKLELKEKISILCPTRGRPENVDRLLNSLKETSDVIPEIVLYVDDDDAQMLEWLGHDDWAPTVKSITGPRITLSDMWNKCAEVATGDILMNCGDDVVFRTKGWDSMVKQAFASYPDRILFAHGDDAHFGSQFGTHGFVHRKWINAVGYFVPPYFSSDYGDVWLNEIANSLGRRVYLPFVTEHMHFLWGKGPKDQTHLDRLERHKQDKVDELYQALQPEREKDVEKLRAVTRKFVSVLIPARGRPESLLKSIRALKDTASQGCIEILVRLDDDDASVKDLPEFEDVTFITGKRHGYKNLHLYYNELAEKASGDWLMLWNDDAVMETKNWDRKIARIQPGLKILNPCGMINTFPVVHRSLYELLGHISLQAHCDTWLQQIGRETTIEINLPVQFKHSAQIDNKSEAYDSTRAEFFAQKNQMLIKEDIDKVWAVLKVDNPKEELVEVG
jgi:hypothetical protein